MWQCRILKIARHSRIVTSRNTRWRLSKLTLCTRVSTASSTGFFVECVTSSKNSPTIAPRKTHRTGSSFAIINQFVSEFLDISTNIKYQMINREPNSWSIRRSVRTSTDAVAGSPECPAGTRATRQPRPSRCVLIVVLTTRSVLYLSSDTK